jgi:hypothetical protein
MIYLLPYNYHSWSLRGSGNLAPGYLKDFELQRSQRRNQGQRPEKVTNLLLISSGHIRGRPRPGLIAFQLAQIKMKAILEIFAYDWDYS